MVGDEAEPEADVGVEVAGRFGGGGFHVRNYNSFLGNDCQEKRPAH